MMWIIMLIDEWLSLVLILFNTSIWVKGTLLFPRCNFMRFYSMRNRRYIDKLILIILCIKSCCILLLSIIFCCLKTEFLGLHWIFSRYCDIISKTIKHFTKCFVTFIISLRCRILLLLIIIIWISCHYSVVFSRYYHKWI